MTVDTCKITTVTVTSFSTNCYIVRSEGSKTCVIIDPGGDGKKILRKDEEGKVYDLVDWVRRNEYNLFPTIHPDLAKIHHFTSGENLSLIHI